MANNGFFYSEFGTFFNFMGEYALGSIKGYKQREVHTRELKRVIIIWHKKSMQILR